MVIKNIHAYLSYILRTNNLIILVKKIQLINTFSTHISRRQFDVSPITQKQAVTGHVPDKVKISGHHILRKLYPSLLEELQDCVTLKLIASKLLQYLF